MSRNALAVDDDVFEAVLEDDLASMIAELRERGQLDDEYQQPAFE
jgi:hypothetical protein